jgi:phosphoribosylaminoimidazole-succinocarboxamide synthase
MTDALLQTDLPLAGRRSGKVRDIYEASLPNGGEGLLIVASDRISAFDVVMANGVPGKGAVLTQISRFWFRYFAQQIRHHLVSTDVADVPGLSDADREKLRGRIMLCHRTRVVPIECVVRGYLAGSGWKEYQQSQTVCGIKLPAGLRQCDQLPEAIFTPSTKAETGHDENIDFAQACQIAGEPLMRKLRDLSLYLYNTAREYAAARGIIIADTKFEFGLPLDDSSGEPILIDEVLTPDSSRFWPADEYEPGHDQPNFDKQYVRNYLQELCDAGKWDKRPPGPALPDDVVRHTLRRYRQACEMLTDEAPPT